MYNVRYHLASLISVFFALAIGLLLGGLLAAEQVPTNVQEALIQQIEREIAQERESNDRLVAANVVAYDFSDMLLAGFAHGRLDDYTVLVIGAAERDVQLATTDLESAGATVVHAAPLYDEEAAAWVLQGDFDFNPSVDFDLEEEQPEFHAIVNVYNPVDEEGEYIGDLFDDLQELGEQLDALLIFASIDNEENTLVSDGWAAGFSGTNQLGNRYGAYTLVVLIASDTVGKFGSMEGAAAFYPYVPESMLAGADVVGQDAEEGVVDEQEGQ